MAVMLTTLVFIFGTYFSSSQISLLHLHTYTFNCHNEMMFSSAMTIKAVIIVIK